MRRWILPLLLLLAVVAGFAAQRLLGVDEHGARVETIEIDSEAVDKSLKTAAITPTGTIEPAAHGVVT